MLTILAVWKALTLQILRPGAYMEAYTAIANMPRCAMHVHSPYATALASLADSNLPPVDQNACMFFNRYVIDNSYGGLAFEAEGERCAGLFDDPKKKVMIMGNHGILVIGNTIAETFNRMFYFERACQTYLLALQTGQPLRILDAAVAEKTQANNDFSRADKN